MSKKKTNGKMTVIAAILFCFIIAGYFYLRQKQENRITPNTTQGQQILALDLENRYPETATSVLKTYCRINKYLYNNKAQNEKEVDKIIEVLRKLYSDELLANNPLEENLKNFKEDIAKYKKEEQKINTYQIQSSKMTETWKDSDERECSSLVVLLNMSKGKERIKLYERFILIKDEDGKWKIHGWKVSPEVDMGTE